MENKQRFKKREYEVLLAVLFAAILNIILSITLIANQHVTLNALEFGLFRSLFVYGALLVISIFIVFFNRKSWLTVLAEMVIGFMTWHLLFNLYSLIFDPRIQENGVAILVDAALIWTQNVIIFSIWYWLFDRGGPLARGSEQNRVDILFPQQQSHIDGWKNWQPHFWDYVYLSFTNSISFAPADTVPLSKRIKCFMMTQAGISLVIIGMVASRALSLIK